MDEGTENRTAATPRRRPCASCPYRRNVPSGIWDETEYAKLREYDGETWEQSAAVFMCHHAEGDVCAGWLGHRDPADLLAVRLGILNGIIDPARASYTTSVPLFETGAAAAEHGIHDIEDPSTEAINAIDKLTRVRTERP